MARRKSIYTTIAQTQSEVLEKLEKIYRQYGDVDVTIDRLSIGGYLINVMK